MNKLSLNFIKEKLSETEKPLKPKYSTQASSKHKKMKTVNPSDPSKKVQKVKQVDTPKSTKPTETKSKSGIPQSAMADFNDVKKASLVNSGKKSESGNTKTPKVNHMKPNQTSKFSSVKKPKTNESFFKGAEDPSSTINKMSRGIQSSDKKDSVLKVAKPENLGATTRPKGKEVKAKFDRPTLNVQQVKTTNGFVSDPSDAPKKPTYQKVNTKSLNLVESGIVLALGGKTKAKFDFVSKKVVESILENYKRYGYDLDIMKTNNVAWKKDEIFRSLMKESIEAKHNLIESAYKDLKQKAFRRFAELVSPSYNSLYESKEEFKGNIKKMFMKTFESYENKYVENLEIFDCSARVIKEDELVDLEIVTEATDHKMALRQIRNKIMEEMGLNVDIKHIFVDGKKYNPKNIQDWAPKSI